jgi:hypothetical protein
MAFVTVLTRDFAIPENGVAVAFIARKPVIENQSVVIPGRKRPHQSFFCVAVAAVIDLGIMFAFFEMTDETAALRDRDVFTLHDLRVTARALKPFSPLEILEMDLVVECDLVEWHLTFKEPFFMTSFTETTVIPDLCPWLGFDVELCPIPSDHDQPFDFFPQFGPDAPSWGVMTHAALDILVRGCFPTFEERFHIMTRGTKIRVGSEFYRTQCNNHEKSEETEENNKSFFLFFRFWHC